MFENSYPFFDGESIISVVGIYTLILSLTNKKLVGMMGSRKDNLTFITIEFKDINSKSIKLKAKKLLFIAKEHTFIIPNNKIMNFNKLLMHFLKNNID